MFGKATVKIPEINRGVTIFLFNRDLFPLPTGSFDNGLINFYYNITPNVVIHTINQYLTFIFPTNFLNTVILAKAYFLVLLIFFFQKFFPDNDFRFNKYSFYFCIFVNNLYSKKNVFTRYTHK